MAAKKQALSQKECNVCGSEIEGNAEYCPECGADFTDDFKYNY